jgi:TonB family protein
VSAPRPRTAPRAPRAYPRATLRALALASTLLPALAGAQASPVSNAVVNVLGVVRSADGTALVGAEVLLTPKLSAPGVTMGRKTVTDDSGHFRIPSIPEGSATIAVRRIGFRPATIETAVPSTVPLAFALEPTAVQLGKVVVQDRRSRYEGPLANFNRRRDLGFGRFITRDDIDRRNALRTTDLLRSLPGVMVAPGRTGISQVRLRSNNCPPFIWLDGSPALAGYLDVDAFDPGTLAGIEVYSGVGTVPVELRGPRGEERCGVIALWSRYAEPRPKRSKAKPVTAEQLAELVASATVYTADQVDQPAQQDAEDPVSPLYPDSLKANKVAGHVVLEFVVDTLGNVETETIGIVLSTHPRFAEAARNAVWRAGFVPAVRQGRKVRQLVQLPVHFEVASAK